MIGASIETTRELWASSLREVKKRIRPLFAQERAALNAGLFVDGLLGDERRKTGWMRAEAAGDPGPWRQQAVLGRNRWDADALRDLVRDYATEHLADENAVLVIDETGFLKQGKASCGVARQYTGSAGKITNCQIGVFAAYVSCHGHAFIDRALYLPKGWTDDPARLKATYVPGDIGFSTKPQLAAEMIERALAAGVPSAGLRPIASMGSAISSGTYAKPVKAMYSASIPIIGLHHGASRNGLSAPPRRSQRRSDDLTGGVCRPVPEPKDRDCTTGATSNWPISKAKTPTITAKSFGHEAC
jgi:DDE superfamily endonuclease